MNNTYSNPTQKISLADICSDIIMLIMQLRNTHEYGESELLRKQIISFLDRMERRAKRNGFNSKEIYRAKFAMISFIDETIMSSEWSQKEAWIAKPLQLQIFNRFDAGEKFFQLLEKFRSRPYDYINLIEIYYLCLALGFKGKYGLNETENLKVLTEDVFNELKKTLGNKQAELSPSKHPKDERTDVIGNDLPVWVFGIGAAAIGLIFYLIMTILNYNAADKVIEFLQ